MYRLIRWTGLGLTTLAALQLGGCNLNNLSSKPLLAVGGFLALKQFLTPAA